MITVRKLVAAVAALATLSLFLAAPVAAAVDNRCPASASACHYRLPASIQSARDACYRAEREARGIPGDRDAYIAWYDAHQGTKVWREWRAAFKRCQDRNEVPGGKWAWSQMVYVGSD